MPPPPPPPPTTPSATMGERLKYIVGELAKPPFDRANFNVISFDALQTEQLLQVLNDVLTEVDPKNKVDIREEVPEDTAVRMLEMLRILKYKPPEHLSASQFRQCVVQADKEVMYPILEWLLQRIPELKKRTYLARYLVRVEVPDEMRGDIDVDELYEQYEMLIENFKATHREYESMLNSGFSTGELRKDIDAMENEKELVMKRIERMHRKVEGVPNKDAMLEVARRLRREREKEKELATQLHEQTAGYAHAEQKLLRLQRQLEDVKKSVAGATPETIMQKLQEEVDVDRYMLAEKLPKEIAEKRKRVATLHRVVAEPLARGDVDHINRQIQEVSAEITSRTEKRMMGNDPMEDKLAMFRQQAAIARRKKDNLAEELNRIKKEADRLQEEANEKQEQLKTFGGDTVLRGDDFKLYVNKLRTKSSVYKKQRAELSELRSEHGVLVRSLEIIRTKEETINSALAAMESQRGVEGFRDAKEELVKVSTEKADVDQVKGKTLEEMSSLVVQLTQRIAERKARLAPVLKELRPLRQQAQEMQMHYDERKQAFETVSAGLDLNLTKMENEVRQMEQDILNNEGQYHLLEAQVRILQASQQQAADEMRLYVSGTVRDRKNSMREKYLQKIAEQEKRSLILKEHSAVVRDSHAENARQMKLWEEVSKLFECKKRCMTAAKTAQAQMELLRREPGMETLVLQ